MPEDSVVEAPARPAELHHPVRLFLGSGASRGLSRQLTERFARAKVAEFYATTEGDAILVNLTGSKPGTKGRALPGNARVRVAAYDVDTGCFVEDRHGYARACGAEEVGMLLARADSALDAVIGTPLRGVFAREDAWHATGDLFWVDDDGDHWLVDNLSTLLRTAHGLVFNQPMQYVLDDVWGVDQIVTYGVPSPVQGEVYAVAALTVQSGREITAEDVTTALSVLEPGLRPDLVLLVDTIPTTIAYRLDPSPLQAQGLPKPGAGAWWHDRRKDAYVPLTAARRSRLLRTPTSTQAPNRK